MSASPSLALSIISNNGHANIGLVLVLLANLIFLGNIIQVYKAKNYLKFYIIYLLIFLPMGWLHIISMHGLFLVPRHIFIKSLSTIVYLLPDSLTQRVNLSNIGVAENKKNKELDTINRLIPKYNTLAQYVEYSLESYLLFGRNNFVNLADMDRVEPKDFIVVDKEALEKKPIMDDYALRKPVHQKKLYEITVTKGKYKKIHEGEYFIVWKKP